MEDVLDVYVRPYNPHRPVICLDEKPFMLHDHYLEPLPMRPGSPAKLDYQYQRRGYCSIFSLIEPLTGQQYVDIRKTRKAVDFAEVIAWLVDVLYPNAERIVLVMDNLNTHVPGSLYKRFPPAAAKRLLDRLEIHYTPKHGSWLNIAEIGIQLFSQDCLNRRIGSIEEVREELMAWCAERNRLKKAIHWQFTTADARIKLRSLYPDITLVTD